MTLIFNYCTIKIKVVINVKGDFGMGEWLSIRQLMMLSGLTRKKIKDLIQADLISTITVGKRILVNKTDTEKFIGKKFE